MATEKLQQTLGTINRELAAVYKFAPNTSAEAYARTDEMLKNGHMAFSDEEINRNLPSELSKTGF